MDLMGNIIESQVSPVFEHASVSTSKFEVAFIANIPPLSLVTYTIEAISDTKITK